MKRRRRHRRWWKIGIIVGIVILCFLFLSIRLRPMVRSVTEQVAQQKMIAAMHQAVLSELEEKGYDYDDFVEIQRDENGKILAISLNMTNVNTFQSEMVLAVQQELQNGMAEIRIPLGTLLGWDLLRGRGPGIPLKVSTLGNLTVQTESVFDSAGINQTRHQIVLHLTATAYCYLPTVGTMVDLETTVPVAETIIVGEVPQLYASTTPETENSLAQNIIPWITKENAA